jgi:hypothetical protein
MIKVESHDYQLLIFIVHFKKNICKVYKFTYLPNGAKGSLEVDPWLSIMPLVSYAAFLEAFLVDVSLISKSPSTGSMSFVCLNGAKPPDLFLSPSLLSDPVMCTGGELFLSEFS